LLVSGPSLADPLNYSFGLFAKQKELALIFSWGCFIRMLVYGSPPTAITTVDFNEKVTPIVFIPDVEGTI
jgi:hypothetical protein